MTVEQDGPPLNSDTGEVNIEELTSRHRLATVTGEYVADMLFRKDKALVDELFAHTAEKTGRYTVKHVTGTTLGPMPKQMLAKLIEDGGISPSLYASEEGSEEWVRIDQIPELQSAVSNKKEQSDEQSIASAVIEGQLDGFGGLPYFFQVKALKRSGWLKFEIGGNFRIVSIKEGQPINVLSTSPTESDESLLIEDMRVSEDQLIQARDFAKRDKITVIDALVELGFIAASAVSSILEENATLRFERLLNATEGKVRFELDDAVNIEKPVMSSELLELCVQTLSSFENQRLLLPFGTEQEALDVLMPSLPEDLPEFAVQIVNHLGQPKDLRTLVGEVGVRGPNGENTLAMVFLLAGLGIVGAGSEEKRGIRDLVKWLNEVGEFGALNIAPTASEHDVQEAIEKNLRSRVKEASRMLPSNDLTLQALNRRIDDFEKLIADPVERYIIGQAQAMGLNASEYSVRGALEAECLERLIEEKIGTDSLAQVGQWIARHRDLVLDHPAISAYQHLVEAANADETMEERERSFERLVKASEDFESSFVMTIAVVEGAIILNHHGHARRALSTAEKMKGQDPRIKLLKERTKARSVKKTKKQRQAEELTGSTEEFARASYFTIGFFAILWVLSCPLQLGIREDLWSGTNGFWFLRRLLLIIMALVGYYVTHKKSATELFSNIGFGPAPIAAVVGILIGMGSGYITPPRDYTTAMGMLVGLAVFHTIAEQLFFTGFLTRELRQSAPSQLFGVGLSAAFYGFYQLTSFSFFYGIKPTWIPFWMLMVVLGAGLPYALLYHFSRSIIPSILCQLSVMVTFFYVCMNG